MVLAPLGAFFTYHANKDSGIFNSDSIKAFFRMLFAIPEKRNVTIKEVIIDDPDYINCARTLEELYNEIQKYNKENRFNKLPSIRSVFFNNNRNTIVDINKKFEDIIDILGNSKERNVIMALNEFPVLSINAISSPFKKIWLNILSIVVFPLGIIIYLRAIVFRMRLFKNLVKIKTTIKSIINTLKVKKLI
jgi:lipopolysaccharide export system permease protein